jgi:hypothetical protein
MSFLFGKKETKPEPTPLMPVPEDKASQLAAERQRKAIAGRQGRQSTMLSARSSGGEAGTSAYGNSLLGQAG